MKKLVFLICIFLCAFACKKTEEKKIETKETIELKIDKPQPSSFEIKDERIEELKQKGYQFFNYVDEKTQDTIVMQQYFIAFLKNGPIRNQNEEEVASLQKEHLDHLSKMYELGYADISGPFGDNGNIRGITIYNVPTIEMADSLANSDPMVKAGRLIIEIHSWWAGKGLPLR